MNLEEQIKAAARELAMRRNVYPKWVASGRMKQAVADHETEAMAAILETLKVCQEGAAAAEAMAPPGEYGVKVGPAIVNWGRPHARVIIPPPPQP